MNRPAGYSGTPLAQKLGIKPGFRLKTKSAPADYEKLLAPLPEGVTISPRAKPPVDLWHLFVTARAALARQVPACMKEIKQDGMIWVSWPKKASGLASDITEEVVRGVVLPLGLVDVKVCAIDQTWSGLKLVIRRANRQ